MVQRFGETKEVLARGAAVECKKGKREFTLKVVDARPHKKNWIVSFEGLASRTEAETLAGALLFVDSGALPALPEGTYYNYQLLGLRVVTADGETLGRVEEILDTAGRDVYVVTGERGEVLLPAIPQVIREVDLEAGEIRVDLIPGLVPEREDR